MILFLYYQPSTYGEIAAALLAFIGSAAMLSAACDINTSSPGCVHFERNSGPIRERTNTPMRQRPPSISGFRTKYGRNEGDSRILGCPALVVPECMQAYIDSYATHPGSDLYTQHPEWIAHDVNGNQLYIQYDCSAGHCSQFAGDIMRSILGGHVLTD